jgi:MYXO-CTERM domain-containing protein
MRRRSLRCIPLALCALVLGCDDDLRTEREQVDLGTNVDSYSAQWSSHEIVEGSTVCVTYEGYRTAESDSPSYEEAEDGEIRACYDERLTGSAAFDESGCISLPDPGRATWEITRRDCELPDTFGDDQLIFDVVPISDVRGAFRYAVPPPSTFDGTEVEGIDALPDGYVAEVGAPVRVIEDRFTSVSTAVVRSDGPELVAVTDPVVVGMAVAGSPTIAAPGHPSLGLPVSGRAGDGIDVTIELPAGELPVGEVEIVARTEIATMTVHPVVLRVADTDLFLELGATAITRDAEGNVLREPPVEWEVVEGSVELVIDDADEDGVADPGPSVSIADACGGARRGELRFAVIEGRIDDHRESARVEWDCVDAAEDGCECRARPGGSGSVWLVALVLFGGLRRRRS